VVAAAVAAAPGEGSEMTTSRWMRLAAITATVAGWLLFAGSAVAAPPPGPPYPDPVDGQRVYDYAGIFSEGAVEVAEWLAESIETESGAQVAVYTQVKPQSDTRDKADADAMALMNQWGVGRKGFDDGLVILFDMEANLVHGQVSLYAGAGFSAAYMSLAERQALYDDQMRPLLDVQEFDGALISALAAVQASTATSAFTPIPTPGAPPTPNPDAAPAPPAGPPYPDPVYNQAVYDYAGIFSAQTIVSAEATIDAIEERTGAEVVVYTQVKPQSDTRDKADADAMALMNQWGVGRKGFDDGLVILFDMEGNLIHGQVSLYAGDGYKAAFLSNEERQSVFDDDMLPLLRMGDMDGALLAALDKVDANATAEHASNLERGRQINALIIVAGVLAGAVLLLIAALRWFVHGRDPFFLDDPSIYMPGPPAGLTPAMATLLLDQRVSKRTTAAALVDLAARGSIAFREQTAGGGRKTGIRCLGKASPEEHPERRLLEGIRRAADSKDYVSPSRMHRLWGPVQDLKSDLEEGAVGKHWLVEAPSAVKLRWFGIAAGELMLAGLTGFFWIIFPVSFLFVLTASLAIAGLGTAALTLVMPARTRQGAQLKVMLLAYRRTLVATMRQSRSLVEVVARRPLPWVETPDQAMAWGVALGLQGELEALLARSAIVAPAAEGTAAASAALAESGTAWSPTWWQPAPAPAGSGGASGSGHGGISTGLFSSTPFPDPGAIFAALGSLAAPPSPPSSGGSSWSSSSSSSGSSSSGGSSWSSGSGGGFSGGGSSGGGGAGGGF
jgi:uncharacterized membrane protein YgcG